MDDLINRLNVVEQSLGVSSTGNVDNDVDLASRVGALADKVSSSAEPLAKRVAALEQELATQDDTNTVHLAHAHAVLSLPRVRSVRLL